MKNVMYVLAGLLVATSAMAQDTGLTVSAGVLDPQGDASILTQKRWSGLAGEVGYVFRPEGYGFGLMPYVGVGHISGSHNVAGRTPASVLGPNSYNLDLKNFGVDFRVKPVDSLPLTLAFGPALHTWKVSRIQGMEKDMGDASKVKLGWRLGVEYAVDAHWSVVGSYTQSEWISNVETNVWVGTDGPKTIRGLNPSRPAYLSLMARFRL